MTDELNRVQKEQVEKKVREFLPDFIARIEKPHPGYALRFAIKLLKERAELEEESKK